MGSYRRISTLGTTAAEHVIGLFITFCESRFILIEFHGQDNILLFLHIIYWHVLYPLYVEE